jgi:hypothetical protein
MFVTIENSLDVDIGLIKVLKIKIYFERNFNILLLPGIQLKFALHHQALFFPETNVVCRIHNI